MSNYIKYGVIIILAITVITLKINLDETSDKIQFFDTQAKRAMLELDNLETTFISSYQYEYEKINNCTITTEDYIQLELKDIFAKRRLTLY